MKRDQAKALLLSDYAKLAEVSAIGALSATLDSAWPLIAMLGVGAQVGKKLLEIRVNERRGRKLTPADLEALRQLVHNARLRLNELMKLPAIAQNDQTFVLCQELDDKLQEWHKLLNIRGYSRLRFGTEAEIRTELERLQSALQSAQNSKSSWGRTR